MSCGALVEEQELHNSRLSYKRLSGSGPDTGWVSLFLKDKPLVVRVNGSSKDAEAEFGEPLPGKVTDATIIQPPKCLDTDSKQDDEHRVRTEAPEQARQTAEPSGGDKSKPMEGDGIGLPKGEIANGKVEHLSSQATCEATAPAEREVKLRMVGGLAAALPRRLKHLLSALDKPVKAILSIRSELEVGRANANSVQNRLTDQEILLQRALEEVRIVADQLDPPATPAPRSLLRCAMPGCRFLVHTRDHMGGFCCSPCHSRRGGSHGPRCQRRPASADAASASSSSEPVSPEQLAEIELEEAVHLLKLNTDVMPRAVRDDTWLESNPKWSQSGKAAIGKWVSSIIDEEAGNPDTAGPKQLLDGGSWISRRMRTTNQWIVFDLGQAMLVNEVRTRGQVANSGCNPRKMQWQSSTKLDGPWKTVVSFDGTPDNNWAVGRMDPPVKSRWWRLYINSNGGRDYCYVWLYGFSLRLVAEQQEPEDEEEPSKEDERKDAASKDGKAGEDLPKEREKKADTDKKDDAHKLLTKEDLRKNDLGWQQFWGYRKLTTFALLYDRVLTFEETPYIDFRWHTVEDYARRVLSQSELMWREEGWSLDHDPNFFCELAYEGFNPIGLEIPFDNDVMIQILSPCFERKRSVLDCVKTHISKRTLKLARHYTITIDTAFDDVMLGCIRQHGEGWLYRGVRWILRTLRKEGYTGHRSVPLEPHSFELWDGEGRLVAGDLGYAMGSVYVSQTGFHEEGTIGLGEVQLVLTSALLHKMGHTWLDLGQTKEYKSALGADTLDPGSWLDRFRGVRDTPCRLVHEPAEGAALLDHLLHAIAASQEDWPLRVMRLPGGAAEPAGGRRFASVCVFGPYHSCTNALARELPRFFDVAVLDNENYKESGKLWKHQVVKCPPPCDDDTFFICLVKDPAFWIQSLAREPTSPRCSSFYELLPVKTESLPSGETKLTVQKAKDTSQLFGPVVFRDELFTDALGVWEATVRNYFDERLLPRSRTAIVRCEDYLFSFDAVMQALAQRGLPLKEDTPLVLDPLGDTAKDESHPELTRRGRPELLKYYSDPGQRFAGLTKEQQARLRRLERALTGPLGYGQDAVASWLPAPGRPPGGGEASGEGRAQDDTS